MDIDAAAELVDLMRALSRWKLNWENICSDTIARTQVTQEAKSWSQRVLSMSGASPKGIAPYGIDATMELWDLLRY
ncbi:MAG: hypothetical protein PUP92_27055 [Rhizonema sp. PD38]|nr:hypothetical protein [Rhizonema sp. PD38]